MTTSHELRRMHANDDGGGDGEDEDDEEEEEGGWGGRMWRKRSKAVIGLCVMVIMMIRGRGKW